MNELGELLGWHRVQNRIRRGRFARDTNVGGCLLESRLDIGVLARPVARESTCLGAKFGTKSLAVDCLHELNVFGQRDRRERRHTNALQDMNEFDFWVVCGRSQTRILVQTRWTR